MDIFPKNRQENKTNKREKKYRRSILTNKYEIKRRNISKQRRMLRKDKDIKNGNINVVVFQECNEYKELIGYVDNDFCKWCDTVNMAFELDDENHKYCNHCLPIANIFIRDMEDYEDMLLFEQMQQVNELILNATRLNLNTHSHSIWNTH